MTQPKRAKATPKKVLLQYIGPFDVEMIMAPTGRRVTVAVGDTITLLPNEAATLNGLPDWVAATTIKAEESA